MWYSLTLPNLAGSVRTDGVQETAHPSANVFFFLCGIGLTYPWNAINAAISAFVNSLGAKVYIDMQALYYLPLPFCLLFQTFYDAQYDRDVGLRTAYTCRFVCTSLGLAIAVGLLMPFSVLRASSASVHAPTLGHLAAAIQSECAWCWKHGVLDNVYSPLVGLTPCRPSL